MMRAKMLVNEVKLTTYGESIAASCVSEKPYGPEGESEDNTFARFSPSGSFTIHVTNPALYGKVKPGMKLYFDITEAPE